MTTATYQQLALDWHPQSKTDKPFVFLVTFILALFMGLGLLMGSIDVPKQTKREKVVIPERVAKFILDKPKVIKKQPPKPKVIKKPLPKPEPIKKEVPKEKPKTTVKKQAPKKPVKLTKKQKKARETASQSGLLALSSELSDLMDTSSIDSMVGTKIAKNNTGTTATQANASDNSNDLLTASASKRSKGVSASKSEVLAAKSASKVKLESAQNDAQQKALLASRADSKIVKGNKKAKSGNSKTERTGNYRPEEDIALVMDQNKSKLHALYRKARRTNPGIEGKIVLEITISPAGKVLKVVVASSELDDKKLERRIIARVKKFNFGTANVKPVTVTYPIEFLPS